jgi:hypothetical protein
MLPKETPNQNVGKNNKIQKKISFGFGDFFYPKEKGNRQHNF